MFLWGTLGDHNISEFCVSYQEFGLLSYVNVYSRDIT